MLSLAQHNFELGERLPDGATMREHLEQVARQTGEIPERLLPPECPEQVMYLWEMYEGIARGREFGRAVSPAMVRDWAILTGVHPTPFELEALFKIDDAYVDYARKVMAKQMPDLPKVPRK